MQPTNKHSRWAMLPVILSLAWPTMLEQLMQTAVQYIDTAMVGALGTHATAAVGATTTLNWLISSTISAMGVGFLAYIARARGAGDENKARRASAQAVLAAAAAGLFFTALTLGCSEKVPVWMQVDPSIQDLAAQYFFVLYLPMLFRAAILIFGTVLRAAGDAKTPMLVGLLVNVINIVLNLLFIFPTRDVTLLGLTFTMPGAGWGVVGAAAASALAFTTGGIVITLALWRHPDISPRGQSFRPNRDILRPCLKTAVPNMFQRFATSLGYVAFAAMVNGLGPVSAAAMTIANTVESAFYIPGFGMQTAASTLAGNALGARDQQRMKDLSAMFIRIELVLMLLSGGALFLFAPALTGLFSTSQEVILLCVAVLRMMALSEPLFGVALIIEGILLGIGNTRIPFLFNLIGMWGVRIVCTFLCTQLGGMGLVAACACMVLHNLVLFVLFLVYYVRGNWNPLTN